MARGSNTPVVVEEPELNGNDERRAAALKRKIAKQTNWRNKVWAETELRILAMNAELAEMGLAPVELEEHDFSDLKVLERLAASEDF